MKKIRIIIIAAVMVVALFIAGPQNSAQTQTATTGKEIIYTYTLKTNKRIPSYNETSNSATVIAEISTSANEPGTYIITTSGSFIRGPSSYTFTPNLNCGETHSYIWGSPGNVLNEERQKTPLCSNEYFNENISGTIHVDTGRQCTFTWYSRLEWNPSLGAQPANPSANVDATALAGECVMTVRFIPDSLGVYNDTSTPSVSTDKITVFQTSSSVSHTIPGGALYDTIGSITIQIPKEGYCITYAEATVQSSQSYNFTTFLSGWGYGHCTISANTFPAIRRCVYKQYFNNAGTYTMPWLARTDAGVTLTVLNYKITVKYYPKDIVEEN